MHWLLGTGGPLGGAETIACANGNDLRVSDPTPPKPEVVAAAAVVHHSSAHIFLEATLKIKMVVARSRPSFVMSADRMSGDQGALGRRVLI